MPSDKNKEGLPPAGGKGAGFISAESFEKIRKLLAYADLVPDPAQFEVVERAGKKHFRYRSGQEPAPGPGGGGGGSAGGSSFCELYQEGADWFIRGGPVQCGIKNFNVVPFEVDTGTDDVFLIYIQAALEAYRTDDGDYFLPGIKTSSETTLVMVDTTAADYPSNTDPVVATGLGTVIFPVGVLTIASGVPSFQATNCGGFRAGQCAGALTYDRV